MEEQIIGPDGYNYSAQRLRKLVFNALWADYFCTPFGNEFDNWFDFVWNSDPYYDVGCISPDEV